MSRLNRFTAFLRRAATRYNEPPEVPTGAIWRGVEEGLADAAAASSDAPGGRGDAGAPAGVDAADNAPIPAPGYHVPPPAPRGEMWERIEASWALQRPAAPASADAGGVQRRRPVWIRWRGRTGWAAALAAAASLVLWMAVDRGTQPGPSDNTETSLPSSPPDLQSAAAQFETGATQTAVAETPAPEPALDVEDPILVTAAPPAIRTGDRSAHPATLPEATVAETPLAIRPGFPADDLVSTRHLDRAATLLTAFRIDQRTPASQRELAGWARELLVDTRVFLDMPTARSPMERALLQDLELVLLQIARLRPGMPDFEWELARETMEWNGTLLRLRAASAGAET